MRHLPVWKFKVTSGHPDLFNQEVVPVIEELSGSSTVTSDIGFETQYWVKLPASIMREELDSLISIDKYSTWVVERQSSFYNPE